MGYSIGIGEARCQVDHVYLCASWDVVPVDGRALGAPPDTRGTEPASHTNEIWPSYIAWADFCESVGLWEVFYGPKGERGGDWGEHRSILASHPGIVRLTQDHLAAFEKARADYTGATMEGKYLAETKWRDTRNPATAEWHRKRLDWLCWWTRWALDNCTNPSIYNS